MNGQSTALDTRRDSKGTQRGSPKNGDIGDAIGAEKGSDLEDALSDPATDSVNAIAQLHARGDRNVSRHQRVIEKLTGQIGRPVAIWVMIALMACWMTVNVIGARHGGSVLDRPPFNWLNLAVTVLSLLIATMILITENRQSKIAERRAQLDLQISLVTEQKIAKLIALVEELRRDMPNVPNRKDPVAEEMQKAADPHAVTTALEYALDEASEEEPRGADSSDPVA